MEVVILEAELKDLPQILKLQKLAFKSEAELNNDFSIPPLHQTLDSIENEFKNAKFLKAEIDGNLVGSVRAEKNNGSIIISKLIVDPEYQGKGIGSKLLNRIESEFEDKERFELFTGAKSIKNIKLYERFGYKIFSKKKLSDITELVLMEKINS